MAKTIKFNVRLNVDGKPQVTQATMAVEELERQMNRASDTGKKMSASFGGIGDVVNKLRGGVGGVTDLIGSISPKTAVAAAGVAAIGKAVADMGSACVMSYAKIQDLQISFETLTGSVGLATDMLSQLKQYGNTTPYDTEGLAQAARLLLSYGMSVDSIMPTIKQLGDISMGDANKLNSMALAFAQMSASGRVCKEDLNQMINAGFNPLQQISEKTGESMGVLLDKVSAGAISVDEIKQAFAEATEEGGKFHNMAVNMSDSVSGKLSTLEDEWEGLKQAVGELIAPAVTTGIEALTNVVSGLADMFGSLKNAAQEAADAVREASGQVGKGRQETYENETQRGLSYAKNKGTKAGGSAANQLRARNRALNQGIYNETHGKNGLDAKDKEIAALRNYIKSDNSAGGNKRNEAKQILSKKLQERDMQVKRIAAYRQALTENPYQSTSVSTSAVSTPKRTTGGKVVHTSKSTASEKVLETGSIDWYNDAISNAQKGMNASSDVDTIKQYQSQMTKLQHDLGELKIQLGIDTVPDIEVKKASENIVDKIDAQMQQNPIHVDIDNGDKDSVASLFNIDTTSFDSVQKALYNIKSITDPTTKGFATAGAACQALGQSMQQLGADSAAAKAGMVMAAIGQIALSFAQALSSCKTWVEWLAFGITGTAQMLSLISTIGSFATGGIIPGNSTSGDKLYAKVNSGEMILNTTQQANLFKLLNHRTTPDLKSNDVQLDMSGIRNLEPQGVNVQLQSRIRGGDIVQSVANLTRTRSKSGRRSKISI